MLRYAIVYVSYIGICAIKCNPYISENSQKTKDLYSSPSYIYMCVTLARHGDRAPPAAAATVAAAKTASSSKVTRI